MEMRRRAKAHISTASDALAATNGCTNVHQHRLQLHRGWLVEGWWFVMVQILINGWWMVGLIWFNGDDLWGIMIYGSLVVGFMVINSQQSMMVNGRNMEKPIVNGDYWPFSPIHQQFMVGIKLWATEASLAMLNHQLWVGESSRWCTWRVMDLPLGITKDLQYFLGNNCSVMIPKLAWETAIQ